MNLTFKNTSAAWFACLGVIVIISACAITPPTIIANPNFVQPRNTAQIPIIPTPILTLTSLLSPTKTATDPSGVPSPVASATPQAPGIFGVSILPAIRPTGGLNQIASAGLQWTRIGIDWKIVEPVQKDRDWSRMKLVEEELLNAAQAGLKVVVILGETPAWAVKPGFICGVIRDDLVAQFASFVNEAVARYSQPPFNIHYWEIFNEPDAANFLGCWGNPSEPYYGGKTYGMMLSQIYPAIKAADPNAQVLIGGLLLDCDPIHASDDPNHPGQKKDCAPARFFEGILVSGAVNAFDGIAFHAYDYYYDTGMYSNLNWGSDRKKDGSSTIAKAAYLRSILKKYDITGRYLINTEFALFCGRANQPDCESYNSSVETTKAYYIVQFAATAVADGYQVALWYASQGGRNNGLLNPDLSPKPAFFAYQFANNMIGSAAFIKMIDLDPAFKIFEFKKNSQSIWVAWTLDGKDHKLNIPKQPDAFYRILSNGQASSEDPAQNIELSLEPVFLVFK